MVMVGCNRELDQSLGGAWAYVYLDTGDFKVPNYQADFHYSNPCGVENKWFGRKYMPLCIDCAKRWGYIW